MPIDPNNDIPQRTEPAVQPEAPVAEPVDDPGEAWLQDTPNDPSAKLEETLSNPATIQAVTEFLKAENLDIMDVEVKEGFWNWTEGADCATIELGSKEYFVSPDSDTTTRLAIALVKNDIDSEPSLFGAFLEQYINRERLRNDLSSDVEEMIREDMRENGEVGEDGEPDEDVIERKVADELQDPVQYLVDMMGPEDGMKKAMEIGGININEAAEDAVSADGEGHFLASYDGNVYDLPSGGQYWRHN